MDAETFHDRTSDKLSTEPGQLQSHPRSRVQTQRKTLLTGFRADIVLLVSNWPQLKIRLAWKRSQAVDLAFSHSLGPGADLDGYVFCYLACIIHEHFA